MLTGPIEIGDRLIWEPRDPKAFARVVVRMTHHAPDGTVEYLLADERGNTYWNEESRVREACVREGDFPTSKKSLMP